MTTCLLQTWAVCRMFCSCALFSFSSSKEKSAIEIFLLFTLWAFFTILGICPSNTHADKIDVKMKSGMLKWKSFYGTKPSEGRKRDKAAQVLLLRGHLNNLKPWRNSPAVCPSYALHSSLTPGYTLGTAGWRRSTQWSSSTVSSPAHRSLSRCPRGRTSSGTAWWWSPSAPPNTSARLTWNPVSSICGLEKSKAGW